ncbi:hypothetical protein PISMIDRAFT_674014, partial [Pisolithus microcarpus 441]
LEAKFSIARSLLRVTFCALFREIERVQKRSSNFGRLHVQYSYPTKPMADPSYDLLRSTLAILLTCRHLPVLKPGLVGALVSTMPSSRKSHLQGLVSCAYRWKVYADRCEDCARGRAGNAVAVS